MANEKRRGPSGSPCWTPNCDEITSFVINEIAVVSVAPLSPPGKLWEMLLDLVEQGGPVEHVESILKVKFEDQIMGSIFPLAV